MFSGSDHTACLGNVRNLCSLKLHVHYEGRRKKTTQRDRAHPPLAISAAGIVSKPKRHKKVSSVDLAVAGDVPLPDLFTCLELLDPCEI